MPLTNNGGRDNPLGCPRRRAQRQATEAYGKGVHCSTFVPPGASLWAGTAQRAIPTNPNFRQRHHPVFCHFSRLGNSQNHFGFTRNSFEFTQRNSGHARRYFGHTRRKSGRARNSCRRVWSGIGSAANCLVCSRRNFWNFGTDERSPVVVSGVPAETSGAPEIISGTPKMTVGIPKMLKRDECEWRNTPHAFVVVFCPDM